MQGVTGMECQGLEATLQFWDKQGEQVNENIKQLPEEASSTRSCRDDQGSLWTSFEKKKKPKHNNLWFKSRQTGYFQGVEKS